MKLRKTLIEALWGNSIALSWMWGLGLFFSVQVTLQFGWSGLISFAVPNALGLVIFGWAVQGIARRSEGPEGLDRFYARWARPFRLVFFLYQILAITLTIFAVVRYLFVPLCEQMVGESELFYLLFLSLTLLIVLAAACLFGEEFNIRNIKYGHGIMMLVLLAGVAALISGAHPSVDWSRAHRGLEPGADLEYWGYAIPLCIGLLLGPWLDLQQWQRAIQIRREGGSVARSYLAGGVFFFFLLLFHGWLALWALGQAPSLDALGVYPGLESLRYGHSVVVEYFQSPLWQGPAWAAVGYYVFLSICILTTLDSGYVALKWFMEDYIKDKNGILFSLLPKRLLTSPIPGFVFAAAFSIFAILARLELEYYMVFYATFFVGYAALAITRCYLPAPPESKIPQIRMFAMGSLAVVIFAYGYFLRQPVLMIAGSVLPLAYVLWLILSGRSVQWLESRRHAEAGEDEAGSKSAGPAAPQASQQAAPLVLEGAPQNASVSWYIENKWFVHSFVATYADTNSVGNVYFGMYAMWVGKTRELFFNHVMPKFDLKTTPFYILTRSFEHKFIRETREFETVTVKVRVADYNRKMVTLEHEIFDGSSRMLGKGSQKLIFVSSKDYGLLDIPEEVHMAFLSFA